MQTPTPRKRYSTATLALSGRLQLPRERARDFFIQRVIEPLRSPAAGLLDLIYPPEPIDVAALTLLDAPCCARCGYPFEFSLAGVEVDCGACSARPPRFQRARAAMAYDEASKPLILAFKHGGVCVNLDMFAWQMVRAGRQMLSDADALVPVPLHNTRLRKRKFNQAALLAGRVSKFSGVPLADALARNRKTQSQGHKSARGRRLNVRGAFKALSQVPDHVILVDDVMTTGATLEACALTLKRAGAKRVDCLTLARVVREQTL